MKTLRSRLIALVGTAGLVLLAGMLLLRPGSPPESQGRFPWVAGALLVIAGGAAWWGRRALSTTGQEQGNRLVCVEKIRLQPGKVLHLVEADGTRLLLSSGGNEIRLVAKLEPISSKMGESQQEDVP